MPFSLPDAAWAASQDAADALAPLRAEFLFPPADDGSDCLYFAGHSLGLQPRASRDAVLAELDDWARLGVEGHFAARNPWLPYHELLTDATARLVGAKPSEVVVMNTLTVNLHLMLVSFYQPSGRRTKILMESGAFPSDRYAVASQVKLHGLDPQQTIVQLAPRAGEATLRHDDILAAIAELGDSLALVLLGHVQYLTGQAFDLPAITAAGHAVGACVGFDLAHGVGNLALALHDSQADFAVWCNYKYLNAGPGGLGGAFVHERHHDADLPRLNGWWGHDKASRFEMPTDFQAIRGAEAWQLSNPPILPLAALRASMALFERAGIQALRQKSVRLTAYLETVLAAVPGLTQLTPRDPTARGAMLTVRVHGDAGALVAKLHAGGARIDLRAPDVIRIAPAPLYTRFADVHRLGHLLLAATY